MITFTRFGNYGKLGNQLFQLASMIGFREKYKCELRLPSWKYAQFFNYNIPNLQSSVHLQILKEPHYHYIPEFWNQFAAHEFATANTDVLGWLQSEKYWDHCKESVKSTLSFQDSLIQAMRARFSQALSRPTIAISIRRGDYVDNPNYELLPIEYYLKAIPNNFGPADYNIIIFSDDFKYCKIHFEGMDNVFYAEGSDIEQLCLMSLCDHFIIANSTFSWWGAYLGEKPHSVIIRPAYLFAGPLLAKSDSKYFYPERWRIFDHKAAPKFDLKDVTFTIPVSYDHSDRKHNLSLNVCMLQRYFDTNIVIGEQGGNKFESFSRYCQYKNFADPVFHRTKMLNEMAVSATTPIIVNWDADVFVSPYQIIKAVDLIRQNKADMVYPYDGRFARVPRSYFSKLERYLDVGVLQDNFKGTAQEDRKSVGGAIFFKKDSFISGGMENEKMISYAPEDTERFERFSRLGYKVTRIQGQIFHMEHYRGENSTVRHKLYKSNEEELHRLRALTDQELRAEVLKWPWVHPYTESYYETITENAIRSRDAVFEILLREFKFMSFVKNVIDIGSGLGEWGYQLKENYSMDYAAVDYKIPVDRLLIPDCTYMEFDLNSDKDLAYPGIKKFDLCLCLEVMEHLPQSSAEKNIERLTKLSDYILFSAAIPSQGGVKHINERWQMYWEKLFNKHGFYASEKPMVDMMRGNDSIEPWYRGNIVLYSNKFEGKAFNYVDPQLWINLATAIK